MAAKHTSWYGRVERQAGIRRSLITWLAADRLHDLLVREHFLRLSLENDLAAIDGIQAVSDLRGSHEVGLSDEQRDPHLFDLVHGVAEAIDYDWSQPLKGFVQQQDRGLQGHGAGDGRHLFLPAAEVETTPLD